MGPTAGAQEGVDDRALLNCLPDAWRKYASDVSRDGPGQQGLLPPVEVTKAMSAVEPEVEVILLEAARDCTHVETSHEA
jgi:hypothetical protein